MSDLLKISLIITAIGAVFCIFQFVLPRQFENSLRDTPLLDETTLLHSANTGRLCRCEMVADFKSVSRLQEIAFAKILFDDRDLSSYRRRRSNYRSLWRLVADKPEEVELFTQAHHIKISVHARDIDIGFLPVLFKGYGFESFNTNKATILSEMVASPKVDCKYVIKGLNISQSVTVIGLLEKNGENLRFKSFPVRGNTSEERHQVIVTKLCSKDLTHYLQENYLVGGALAKLTNDDSHYESEPSVSGLRDD